jgi:8-oxo-dGTP diphosphatase
MKYCYDYEMFSIATDIIVFRNNKTEILLIERGNEPFKNMWAFPGGHVEINETFEECAYRELKEETNITDISLKQIEITDTINRDPRSRVISVAFVGELKNNKNVIIAGDDAKNTQWFPLNNLPKMTFDHLDILKKILNEL